MVKVLLSEVLLLHKMGKQNTKVWQEASLTGPLLFKGPSGAYRPHTHSEASAGMFNLGSLSCFLLLLFVAKLRPIRSTDR